MEIVQNTLVWTNKLDFYYDTNDLFYMELPEQFRDTRYKLTNNDLLLDCQDYKG